MKSRVFGSILGGAIGFSAGTETGIVGSFFGAIAGVFVFTAIGVAWRWSAGPDLVRTVQRWRRKCGPKVALSQPFLAASSC